MSSTSPADSGSSATLGSTPQRPRLGLLDGLRGVAIVLVVMSHGWTIWPTTWIASTDGVRELFRSGNFAVSIFFVIGAFLTTQALLRGSRESKLLPGVSLIRRWVRLGAQMYVLLLVLLLAAAVDSTDPYPEAANGNSVFHAATFTWNWYVRAHTLEARPDIGHLWYLAVDMQVFVMVVILAWVLRRHRGWLVVALAALLISLLAWRSHVYVSEGQFSALLRTSARGDAPLTGALAAAAMPFLGRLRPYAGWLVTLGTVALIPLLFIVSGEGRYFQLPGVLLNLALAAIVIGCALAPAPRLVDKALGARWLTFLGRHSLSIYLWHYPIFWFVSRHTPNWQWELRTLAALALTALAAMLCELLVEPRVQRFLASPGWRRLDRGIGPAAIDAVRHARKSFRPGQTAGARTSDATDPAA